VGRYLIGCHLRPEKEERFQHLVENTDASVIALPDDGALVVEQGQLVAIGTSEVGAKVISHGATRAVPVNGLTGQLPIADSTSPS